MTEIYVNRDIVYGHFFNFIDDTNKKWYNNDMRRQFHVTPDQEATLSQVALCSKSGGLRTHAQGVSGATAPDIL